MKRIQILSGLWKPFIDINIPLHAASSVFFLVVSYIQAGTLLLSVFMQLPVDEEFRSAMIAIMLPEEISNVYLTTLKGALFERKSLMVFCLSMIATLWSASKGVLSLMDGAAAIMEAPPMRGYIRRKVKSILCYILLSLSIVLMLAGIVLVAKIFETFLSDYMISFFRIGVIRVALSIGILSSIFTLVFRILPPLKLPIRCCFASGFITALAWIMLSSLFRLYIEYSTNFSIYGSLGFLFGMLIWMYACVILILCGVRYSKLKSFDSFSPCNIILRTFRKNATDR